MDYSTLPPEELLVVCLRHGDEHGWRELVKRFQPMISIVVLRTARRWGETSPDLLDDLVQETFLKLCADRHSILQNFQPSRPDAIFGYIKVLTANLVHDHLKALYSEKRGRNLTSNLDEHLDFNEGRGSPVSDVELLERNVLISQIDKTLAALESGANSERDRKIFWLHYRAGLSANAIAAVPSIGLSAKGVESTLFRLTRYIRAKLCQPKQETGEQGKEDTGIFPAESF